MREESSAMFGYDSYDHAQDKPRVKGIDQVRAAFPASDVIINGNQCFFSGGIPIPKGMTDGCDGRLCVGRVVLRPPSDDTHHALGGAIGRWIGCSGGNPDIINGQIVVPSLYTLAAGKLPEADPATPDQGIGGLSTNYTLGVRQIAENQVIGHAASHEQGKGVVFTATNFPGKGGKASEFSADARKSGVALLPGGDADDFTLLHLDGSSSVGLCLRNPSDGLKTVLAGGKHNPGLFSYYINTYLLFECTTPRP